MNTLAYKNILEGNWEYVKGQLQSKWGKLTDNDIDKINGSYKKLVGKLQKLYGYELEEIEDEIIEFFDTSDFDKIKKDAVNKVLAVKEIVLSTLDEYCSTVKQKTYDAEKVMVDYVKENPIKTLGFAALTGMLAVCLCKSRK